MAISVHIGPSPVVAVSDAVTAAGGVPVGFEEADAVVWLDSRPDSLPALGERVRWVQLPGAGVEPWLERVGATPGVTFTSATGVYARPVAEHALTLLLAGVRRLGEAARASTWRRDIGGTLDGAAVAVVGAGGIGSTLIGLLTALGARPIAVTRSGRTIPGAAMSLVAGQLDEMWRVADHVVVAAPSTPDTRGLIGEAELARMPAHGWLVNIARGSLVDTDAVVDALNRAAIGGAALDVTEPEPLPDGHPLWNHPRAIVTAHVATPPADRSPHFAARVRENLRRLQAGLPLISSIDLDAGY